MEVELALPVRTYDIDFAGVVSNIVYVRWLEDLRLAIVDAYFPLTQQRNTYVVDVIGHTDGQINVNSSGNLDEMLEEASLGNQPLNNLRPGSNADLGLM